jgi:hypothetical protein
LLKLGGGRESEKRVMDPGVAEAMALFHGVSLCISLGFHNVFLEGDAKIEEKKKRGSEWVSGMFFGMKKKKKKRGRERWGRKCAVEREMGKENEKINNNKIILKNNI